MLGEKTIVVARIRIAMPHATSCPICIGIFRKIFNGIITSNSTSGNGGIRAITAHKIGNENNPKAAITLISGISMRKGDSTTTLNIPKAKIKVKYFILLPLSQILYVKYNSDAVITTRSNQSNNEIDNKKNP